MKIFRKKKETDTGKRVAWTQSNTVTGKDGIVKDGIIFPNGDDNSFVFVSESKSSKNKSGLFKDRTSKFYYKPGNEFSFTGTSKNAIDELGRRIPIMFRSTEGNKHIKYIYRDFIKDTEEAFKNSGTSQGKIDKELREAIKKEIRKQHKIYNIKRVSKVAAPVLVGSTLLGIAVKNKKKDK